MSLAGPLVYYGTGKPVNPVKSLRVNREPSRQGVEMSSARTPSDFNALVKNVRTPSIRELGQNAVRIQKSTGRSVNITI